MKAASFLFSALFLLIAALQLNDPDPVYWILVYTGTAFVLATKGLNRFSEFWGGVVIGSVLAGLIWSGPGFWLYLQAGDPGALFGDMLGPTYVESSREFLGLVFALALLLYAKFYST